MINMSDKTRRKTKPGALGGKKNPNSRRNALLITLSVGIIAGIPIGMLLQPIFLSILPTEETLEAELNISIARDCKIILNDTTEGGLGKRTFDYITYANENISGSTMAVRYGYFENPEIHLDLIDLSQPDISLNELREELEDRGYEEEDADFFSSIYPRAMSIGLQGFATLNLMSEDFFFPFIDVSESPPEAYWPSGTLIRDDLELSKDKPFTIDQIVCILEMDYDVSGGLIEDDYIYVSANLLLNVPRALISGELEDHPLDVLTLRESAFIEEGDTRDIIIEEFFFNINEFDELNAFSMDLVIDNRPETLYVLGGST